MRCFRNKNIIRWLDICGFIYPISILYVLGCAPLSIKEGAFSPSHKNYTIRLPEKGWEPIKRGKEDISFRHKQYQATIAIISSDIEHTSYSLEMLSSQLFIGMKDKKILLKETALVDNQSAMHTIVVGEMENCMLKINSYVIRKEDRVYDLVYWAPSDSFDRALGDFEDFVRSFKFTFKNSK